MICTMNAVNAALRVPRSPSSTSRQQQQSPALSPREVYLRALEHEHNVLLAEAYAQKGAPFPSRCSSSSSLEVNPPTPPPHAYYNRSSYFSASSPSSSSSSQQLEHDDVIYATSYQLEENNHRYDDRGRLMDFRESVRQRQQRLEFLRRQEFARRLALKGLSDSRMSEYAIMRLAPPQARPAERLNAALKIQRAFRAHLAAKRILSSLSSLASDLDTAQYAFSNSQRRKSSSWSPAALRQATAGMRSYSNALARLRLDFAEITRPLRIAQIGGKDIKIGHMQSVMARVRAVNRVISEEYDVLEKVKVDVGIAEMRRRMSKKPWMVMIEEQVAEEAAAEAEMLVELALEEDLEEDDDDVLSYYTASDASSISSPASTLATLSDDSLEDLTSEGEHYTIEAKVMEDDVFDSESEFEISHNEFILPNGDADDDEDDVPNLRRTLALSLLYSDSSSRRKQGSQGHSRKRHPVVLSDFDLHISKHLLRGGKLASRTPSLGSISEDDE